MHLYCSYTDINIIIHLNTVDIVKPSVHTCTFLLLYILAAYFIILSTSSLYYIHFIIENISVYWNSALSIAVYNITYNT